MTELLTRSELVEKLRITDRTLHKLIKKGLPCINVGEGTQIKMLRFDYEEVINWLKNNNK